MNLLILVEIYGKIDKHLFLARLILIYSITHLNKKAYSVIFSLWQGRNKKLIIGYPIISIFPNQINPELKH